MKIGSLTSTKLNRWQAELHGAKRQRGNSKAIGSSTSGL